MSMVRVQLEAHQPALLSLLDTELHGWRDAWGEEAFSAAERAAMELLRGSSASS